MPLDLEISSDPFRARPVPPRGAISTDRPRQCLAVSDTMESTEPAPLTLADVRRRLGLSRARVIQLDEILRPTRGAGGYRFYDAARVEALAAERRTAAERRSHGVRR